MDFAPTHDISDDEEEKACHCCAPRRYHAASVSDRDGSVRSHGKYLFLFGNQYLSSKTDIFSVY